ILFLCQNMRPLFLLFLLSSLTGCDRRPVEVGEPPVPKSDTSEADDPLSRGLQDYEGSLSRLKSYCDLWAAEYVPITDDELKQKESWFSDVYEIFEDFWMPTEPHRLAGDDEDAEIGDPYFGSPFLVLQPSVSVSFIDTWEDSDDHSEKTIEFALKLNRITGEDIDDLKSEFIEDFRPRVSSKGRKIVRLTEMRRQSLLSFLGDEHYPIGTGNIMNPATAKGESKTRANYISHYLPVIHGHFEGWHLETHPNVIRILLNTARTEAHVDFQFIYKGGTAYYRKENGKWTLKNSEFTWVQ
ncbi:MAG: hypothetical protein KDM63_12570, partial [Verrucomicrobiae bacterium]|nr:hypothetical protein [Verrucomicrobiae bacterium]